MFKKKRCRACDRGKKFFEFNYSKFKLHENQVHPFPHRIQEFISGEINSYLCEECAEKYGITCRVHGSFDGKLFKNGKLLKKCKGCEKEMKADAKEITEEISKYGKPPVGYDRKEAVELSTSDPIESGLKIQSFLSTHPCRCGGEWDLIVGNSPMPSGIADNGYNCKSCKMKKWFRFRLWETGTPFPKSY